MNFSVFKSSLGGVLLLLFSLQTPVICAGNSQAFSASKPKKETKYDRLFKDKKIETARSKFITVHKMDNRIYFELPRTLLKKQMMLGGTIVSTTDPDYVVVGAHNFNPILFYFDIQDSAVVMKTPNNVLFQDNGADTQLKGALALTYRDAIWNGFNIAAYSNDSSAVVFDVTSLLGKPNSALAVMPTKKGNYALKATPKSELSFIRSVKSFDTNLTITNDFSYGISKSLMSMPIGGEMPTTVGVSYTVALLPESTMRPRIMDSRIGVNSSVRLEIPNGGTKSQRIFYAHRWNLVPKDKKGYAKGKLTEPVTPIRFYVDDAFPENWKKPIREGVLQWNKAFEKIGFKNAIEVVDFPQKRGDFDPDNIEYSCIRYVPSGASALPSSDIHVNPNTGEIMEASMFIYSNIETLLHRQSYVETAAVDPSVRSNRLPEAKFAEALSFLVTKEIGRMLGLLDNPGASATYPTDSLRNARFTTSMGLTPSVMDDFHYNTIAQPMDKGVRLVPAGIGMYDAFTINWNYRYFNPEQTSLNEEKKILEAFVDSKIKNPRLRYYDARYNKWDPRAQSSLLGSDFIATANYTNKNLSIAQKGLTSWIKNDEDSRIKEKLYWGISQARYALFQQVLSNVGGIYINNMKISSGVPRYQVVSKALQQRSLQWVLQQAVHFTDYADRAFERKGFMAVSYYDQSLEYMAYEILAARTRVAVSAYLNPATYSQKDYFDDVFNVFFKSAAEQRAPSQGERIMQRTFMNYAQAAVSKVTGSGSSSGASGGRAAFMQAETSTTPGFGDPGLNLSPNVDLNIADNSELYFYNSLLRLRPLLQKCLKGNLPLAAKTHYEMLLFKLNKTMEVKK